MPITTTNIPSIGSPVDDPTMPMPAVLYEPDPIMWPGPRPCIVGTHSPGFKYDNLSLYNRIFGGVSDITGKAFAANGYICLAFSVRGCVALGPGAPGQTTSGVWHQQTDDFQIGTRAMRPPGAVVTAFGLNVSGFVGAIGPSGGAHNALWWALDGDLFDNKLDACVTCSAPTDFGDRTPGPHMSPHFIAAVQGYGNVPGNDLSILSLESPIAGINNLASNLDLSQASSIQLWNGDDEDIPQSQKDRFDAAMALAGGPGFARYESHLNTGTAGQQHAFAMWDFVADQILLFMNARVAAFVWGGGGSPPPPTPPPPPPPGGNRVRVTAAITDLSPGLPYNFAVTDVSISSGLASDPEDTDFISDKATGAQGKDAPIGNYVLVKTTDGIVTGDIATRAWWDFAYVNGAIFPTTWSHVNTPNRNNFNWTDVDAFVAAAVAKGKPFGISIDTGIAVPPWMFLGGNAVRSFAESGPFSGTIPIPWDMNYLKLIKALIIAFAAKYASNTLMSYAIMSGFGQLLDTILVRSGDYAALNAIAVADGFADLLEAWTSAATQIVDFWVKAMKGTTCYLAIELPVPLSNGGLTGIDQFVRDSIDHYKSSFGVMTLELDGATAAGMTLSLNSIIRDSNRNPRAYQMVRPSSDPDCDPTQDPGSYDPELGLRNAANAGIAIGVQMEEFFEEDILNETAPYPDDFTQFQADLTSNGGGGPPPPPPPGPPGPPPPPPGGNTIVADSVALSDVQDAVDLAVDGDTVVIPAGSADWATGITINDRAIKIMGAGSGRIIARATTTSVTVGTGSKTFTIQPSLSINVGDTLRIVQRADQTTSGDGSSTDTRGTFMLGTVTSYSGSTLVMNITSVGGSGSHRLWYVATEASTIINYTGASGAAFTLTASGSTDTMISGIKFTSTQDLPASQIKVINGTFTTVIHDCWFQSSVAGSTGILCATNRVVIYNCSFDAPFFLTELAIQFKWEDATGDLNWTTADTIGNHDSTGTKNAYIENCDFHYYLNAVEAGSNSRVVLRNSLLDNSGIATLGGETASGVRHLEIYDDTFVFEPTSAGAVLNIRQWILLKGGTAVVSNNGIPLLHSGDFGDKNTVSMICEEIRRNSGSYACSTTYPVPRSPGQGNNGTSDITDPIRIWSNSGTGSAVVAVTQYEPDDCGNGKLATDFTQLNRDYFLSARPGFNKFTYPHPLHV